MSVAPCLARRWRDRLLELLLGIAWRLWASDPATLVFAPGGPGLDADFHLKVHTGFDPGMAVGHFDVRRARAP